MECHGNIKSSKTIVNIDYPNKVGTYEIIYIKTDNVFKSFLESSGKV